MQGLLAERGSGTAPQGLSLLASALLAPVLPCRPCPSFLSSLGFLPLIEAASAAVLRLPSAGATAPPVSPMEEVWGMLHPQQGVAGVFPAPSLISGAFQMSEGVSSAVRGLCPQPKPSWMLCRCPSAWHPEGQTAAKPLGGFRGQACARSGVWTPVAILTLCFPTQRLSQASARSPRTGCGCLGHAARWFLTSCEAGSRL